MGNSSPRSHIVEQDIQYATKLVEINLTVPDHFALNDSDPTYYTWSDLVQFIPRDVVACFDI